MEEASVGMGSKFRSFLVQCGRVWHVLKKPTAQEFKAIAKISALGILIIGAIGFVIADVIRIFS